MEDILKERMRIARRMRSELRHSSVLGISSEEAHQIAASFKEENRSKEKTTNDVPSDDDDDKNMFRSFSRRPKSKSLPSLYNHNGTKKSSTKLPLLVQDTANTGRLRKTTNRRFLETKHPLDPDKPCRRVVKNKLPAINMINTDHADPDKNVKLADIAENEVAVSVRDKDTAEKLPLVNMSGNDNIGYNSNGLMVLGLRLRRILMRNRLKAAERERIKHQLYLNSKSKPRHLNTPPFHHFLYRNKLQED